MQLLIPPLQAPTSADSASTSTAPITAVDPQLVETLLDELIAQGRALRRLQHEVRDLRAYIPGGPNWAPIRGPPQAAAQPEPYSQVVVARARAHEDQLERLLRSVDQRVPQLRMRFGAC